MARFTVILDACVLYPAPLRDLLLQLAVTDIHRARWTAAIHDEWMRNALANRLDLRREQLERTRDLMNRHVRECLVTGYEELIPSLTLPDPDDRHVLAAAIRCRADAIVTFNLRDFPAPTLERYEIEAIHPDDFVSNELDIHQAIVCTAVKTIRGRLKAPPRSVDQYLTTLEAQGLPQIVARLREFAALL